MASAFSRETASSLPGVFHKRKLLSKSLFLHEVGGKWAWTTPLRIKLKPPAASFLSWKSWEIFPGLNLQKFARYIANAVRRGFCYNSVHFDCTYSHTLRESINIRRKVFYIIMERTQYHINILRLSFWFSSYHSVHLSTCAHPSYHPPNWRTLLFCDHVRFIQSSPSDPMCIVGAWCRCHTLLKNTWRRKDEYWAFAPLFPKLISDLDNGGSQATTWGMGRWGCQSLQYNCSRGNEVVVPYFLAIKHMRLYLHRKKTCA